MTRTLLVTGAGGVGKTTVAAAIAVRAARNGLRTLVVTVDPARRLAGALGVDELGNEPQPHADEPNLWALVSEWEGAGFYRRALSAARMELYPLMILMVNEPSAFEDVYLRDRA